MSLHILVISLAVTTLEMCYGELLIETYFIIIDTTQVSWPIFQFVFLDR